MNKIAYFINSTLLRDFANQLVGTKQPVLDRVVVQISFKPNFFNVFKVIPFIVFVLEYLTGQKTKFSYSTSDVSYWKLRKKQIVAIHVTLRGQRMFLFIERFLFTLLPKLSNTLVITFPNSNTFCYFIQNFILFSELERETILFNKKNANFCKFNMAITFVLKNFYPQNVKNGLFFVNQLQFSIKK